MSLPTLSQSVSNKGFYECLNHKKKLNLRHPLPIFGSFRFFQASLWLRVDKVLQKLTKSYKSELRDLFQCSILIPRKCPRKTPFQHTVPPLPPGSDSPVSHSFFYRLCTLSNLWAVIYFILLIFLMNENISLHKKKKNILLYKKMFLRNS